LFLHKLNWDKREDKLLFLVYQQDLPFKYYFLNISFQTTPNLFSTAMKSLFNWLTLKGVPLLNNWQRRTNRLIFHARLNKSQQYQMSFLVIKSVNLFNLLWLRGKKKIKKSHPYQPIYQGFPCIFASLSDMLKTSWSDLKFVW